MTEQLPLDLPTWVAVVPRMAATFATLSEPWRIDFIIATYNHYDSEGWSSVQEVMTEVCQKYSETLEYNTLVQFLVDMHDHDQLVYNQSNTRFRLTSSMWIDLVISMSKALGLEDTEIQNAQRQFQQATARW